MWFYLGIAVFFVSINVYLRQQLKFKSLLEKRVKTEFSGWLEKSYYQYNQQDFQKIDLSRLSIEISCETTLQFYIKRENNIDKLAKMLGISEEFHTNNPQFDKQFYLTSITQEDTQTIGKDAEIMQLIRAVLFNSVSGYEHFKKSNKNKIICDGKKLYVELYFKKSSKITPSSSKFNHVIHNIFLLRTSLKAHKISERHFWKIPAQRNTAIFSALSLALVTWGGFEIIRFITFDNVLFSPFSLVPNTLILTTLTLLLIALLILRLIKKSARRHMILVNVLLISSFGLAFVIYGLLYDINVDLDKRPEEVRSYEVLETYKKHHRSRRSSYYTYHLKLKNAEPPVDNRVKISSGLYSQIAAGDSVKLIIRNGYLSEPWLQSIHRCIECNKDF
ncbi:MAG: hypothetical protein BVN34_00300 [Proteobacteria bacterium ST_bin12]|nr:MAG: hypothetical protein BVN34_00300 [Proteobacteria bacterium ST_bin12]